MYCPECRESGRFPWNHRANCVQGLGQTLHLYEIGFFGLLIVIVIETVLLAVEFAEIGACR
jgi:hypothetical protein